jgi:hypothetical protein
MCPISSGNWNNSSNAGVWMLNLNNVRGNSNNNVGFRADSVSRPHSRRLQSGTKGGAFRQSLTAKSVDRFVSRRARVHASLERHGAGA